jgi:excisionase family DNA binding protein
MTDARSWPELLTIAEVAAILRVSKMTAYRLVHGGTLEAVRAGRSFRVHAWSLEQYLKRPAVD